MDISASAKVYCNVGDIGPVILTRFQEGGEAMVTDFRKMVNRISIPAGWEAGVIPSSGTTADIASFQYNVSRNA